VIDRTEPLYKVSGLCIQYVLRGLRPAKQTHQYTFYHLFLPDKYFFLHIQQPGYSFYLEPVPQEYLKLLLK